nr:hypothetical protein [Tanacetum cinerariifolium]
MRRNRRRSKQPFILEESLIDTMVDQRTMAELLRAPTEGYAEAIVVPPILADQFELKHSLINIMTLNQLFGLEKDNSMITSVGAARRWLEKEPRVLFSLGRILFSNSSMNSFSLKNNKYPDNIQGYVSAAAVNYNQEQSYQAPTQQNQVVPLNELEKVKRMNEANMKAMQTRINNVKNELRNEIKNLIQASMSNQTNELNNMMASFFQMNAASTSGLGSLPSKTVANPKGELKAITTRSGLVIDGAFVPTPPPSINQEEDERVKETLTDQDISEYTIKVPPVTPPNWVAAEY